MLTETQRIRLEELCQDLESPEQAADMALLAAEAGGYHAALDKIEQLRAIDEANCVDELVTELTKRGPTFSGGDARVRETALEWRSHGFDRESAEPWLELGIWEPDVAATFRDWPLRPATVRLRACEAASVTKYDLGTDILYGICNRDLPIAIITQEQK